MQRTATELRAQSIHVLWTLRQLMATATHLGRCHDAGVRIMEDPTDAAMLDAFSLYGRALIEFLWRDRRDRRGTPRATDAVAADWFKGEVWRKESLPEELIGVADRTGWGAAHISYTRQREHPQWDHEMIAHRIAYRFSCFSTDVNPAFVMPGFRDRADAAIVAWRATLPISVLPSPPRISATPSFPLPSS
jgi:hypothetical protein